MNDGREGIDFDLAISLGQEGVKMSAEANAQPSQQSASQQIVNRIKFRIHPSLR